MGVFIGLISRSSLFELSRNAETCVDCKPCDKACPVNIAVAEIGAMNSAQCSACDECVSACPVKDTRSAHGPFRRVLSPVTAGAFAVGTFAVPALAATATGDFD